jgi:hypothetical protein
MARLTKINTYVIGIERSKREKMTLGWMVNGGDAALGSRGTGPLRPWIDVSTLFLSE